jgi:RNA polymerase sigma-70 factor (ECF subfamily)
MAAFALDPNSPLATLSSVLAPDETQNDEQALARKASRGDHRAFAELVRRAQRSVYGLSLRLLGDRDAAADAAQEAFARAYAALASYDPAQRFETWVLRIARNHCFDLLRRRGHLPAADEAAAAAAIDEAPSALERLEQAELTRSLEAALERLSPTDREVLALYYVQRRRTREIAEIVGVAPGTVMARLFRAREKLRRVLTEIAE